MKKRMIIMLICVGILFGAIFGWKLFTHIMFKRFIAANQSPIVTVSTTKAETSEWQQSLRAVGSIRSPNGVNVTTELAGMVQSIYLTPGAYVDAGTVLVQLNADNDIALLNALRATAELSKITYERDTKQFAVHAVSKQTVDSDLQNMKNAVALADQQAAIVMKKTIKAPFAGRLGISLVNLGQFLNPGDKIVTLQALDPIYIDFAIPQQQLTALKIDLPVTVTSDAFPNKTFPGKLTTIDPLIDINTRNVQVEATLPNPEHALLPGMFAVVTITTGEPQKILTLPQTAVSFNPYGDVVFLVENKGTLDGKPLLTVKQVFVKTGAMRGEQIQILQGLKEGEEVVNGGQLKLKNGTRIAVNNTVKLPNEAEVDLPNNH